VKKEEIIQPQTNTWHKFYKWHDVDLTRI